MTPSRTARAARGLPGRDAARVAIPVLAGLLVYLTSAGGLFFKAEWIQLPVVVGATVGLASAGRVRSALLGAGTMALGVAVALPAVPRAASSGTRGAALVAMLPVAAAAALAVRRIVEGRKERVPFVTAVVVLLLLANLLVSALAVSSTELLARPGSTEVTSVLRLLETPPPEGTRMLDDQMYVLVQEKMAEGMGFYEAYASSYAANATFGLAPPGSVFTFRPPLVFSIRDAVGGPPAARFLLSLYALVAAAVVLCAVVLAGPRRAPLAVVSASALCAYYLWYLTRIAMAYPDPWASAFGLLGFSLVVAGVRGRRVFYAAGVGLCVVAVLSRELMLFLPVAGIVSAALGAEDRRFRTGAWLAGAGAIAIGLAIHYRSAQPWISPSAGASAWFLGSPSKLVLALEHATDQFAGAAWSPFVLAAAGLAGAARLARRPEGLFVSLAVGLPLVGFLFFANPARDVIAGVSMNYWGVIVVPLLYALLPAAFGWLLEAAIPAGGTGAVARRARRKAS